MRENTDLFRSSKRSVFLRGTDASLDEISGGTGQITYVKGDIVAASDEEILERLAVGDDGQFIVAEATADTGLQWSSTLTLSGMTEGSVTFINASSQLAEDNTNFFWDDTNNRLGIGTNTPGTELDVAGDISVGGSNNELRFYEGANYVGFEAPALTGDQIWVLPAADGNANEIIETNGSGTLTWTGSPTFTGITLSTFTEGSVLYAGASGVVRQDNANLFYNGTTKRVGIGTDSPDVALDVRDDAGLRVGDNGEAELSASGTVVSLASRVDNNDLRFTVIDGGVAKETLRFIGSTGEVVVNEGGVDVDCRIEGNGDVNLFYTDAGNDRVGIKTASPIATFDVNGGVAMATAAKTTTYTATIDDYAIYCDASGGAFTVTLPAVANATGLVLHTKKTDSSANAVTIDGSGSETIDGATTRVISAQYDSIMIQCDGTEWWII